MKSIITNITENEHVHGVNSLEDTTELYEYHTGEDIQFIVENF